MSRIRAREKKNIIYAAAGAICVLLLGLAAVFFLVSKKNQETNQGEKAAAADNAYVCDLQDGILIQEATQYSGTFWEDGSDRNVENVWQLTVINTSQEDIQFLRILAEAEGQTAQFDITTLPAGEKVMVLESSAMEYPEWAESCTYQVENLAYFSGEMSLHTDIFTVSAKDNWIQVENHSDQDITNDIYVYYKNAGEEGFLGGITYRVKFEGGVSAGESREEQAMHYDSETSKIIFLTYD